MKKEITKQIKKQKFQKKDLEIILLNYPKVKNFKEALKIALPKGV